MNRSPLLLVVLALAAATSAVLIASCLPDLHPLVGRPCDAEHGCEDSELVCCLGTCQPASGVAACDGAGGGDGGTVDGGTADGGAGDGGPDGGDGLDGGAGDAGAGDGGADLDAGTSEDGGCPPSLLSAGFEQTAELSAYQGTGAGNLARATGVVRTGTGALRVSKSAGSTANFFGAQLDRTLLASQVREGPLYCVAAWLARGSVNGELRLIPRAYGPNGSSDYDPAMDAFGDRQTLSDSGWHLFLSTVTLTPTYNYSLNFRTSADTAAGSVFFVDDVRVWESPDGGCEARCAP